jgi:hypothetical protein
MGLRTGKGKSTRYFGKLDEKVWWDLGEIIPSLHRSKDIEASGFNGTAAFMEVRVQSIVVEFILTHVDQLFGGAALSGQCPSYPSHSTALSGDL